MPQHLQMRGGEVIDHIEEHQFQIASDRANGNRARPLPHDCVHRHVDNPVLKSFPLLRLRRPHGCHCRLRHSRHEYLIVAQRFRRQLLDLAPQIVQVLSNIFEPILPATVQERSGNQ